MVTPRILASRHNHSAVLVASGVLRVPNSVDCVRGDHFETIPASLSRMAIEFCTVARRMIARVAFIEPTSVSIFGVVTALQVSCRATEQLTGWTTGKQSLGILHLTWWAAGQQRWRVLTRPVGLLESNAGGY